jgi:hypothetical protein
MNTFGMFILHSLPKIIRSPNLDIRNMNEGQWLFWSIGIPLTVLVIAVAVLWSGEWRNIRDSIRSALRPEKHKPA